ncbi:transglutaminase family protein [Winogradskyella schleiferi]|uniref:transglutaminase family protein n=1 Tax=Winogradskyella schleiferi TaxID=2686078 RepID=UPI0015B7C151|nr:transglutaminase family protein [Winogradskyella schleiferi]
MIFKITHQTEYVFDSEVFLEPHYLRFQPRQTAYVDVNDFSIEISPKPTGQKIILDEEQNVLNFCWFEDTTDRLSITATTLLETKAFNPFEFLIYPLYYNQLPLQYETPQSKLLFSSLEGQLISEELLDYGNAIIKTSNFRTIPYLTLLTKQLHDDFKVEYRAVGSPLLPDETFQLKKGSCRDLSWMQIHLLRQQGLAARFVSGYYYFDMEHPEYELHAWVEVFLPGTGWLGLDPSHGVLTGNTHFPIASSANSIQTMPVSGGIRGSATSKLITKLLIEKL